MNIIVYNIARCIKNVCSHNMKEYLCCEFNVNKFNLTKRKNLIAVYEINQ